jgi:hypothetical protein
MLRQAIAMSEPVAAKDVLILALIYLRGRRLRELITALIEPQAPLTPQDFKNTRIMNEAREKKTA